MSAGVQMQEPLMEGRLRQLDIQEQSQTGGNVVEASSSQQEKAAELGQMHAILMKFWPEVSCFSKLRLENSVM